MKKEDRLKGGFGEFSLADIIQLISMGGKSGRLSLQGASSKQTGSFYFEYGYVVHADCNGDEGEEAARSLFAHADGAFEFIPGQAAGRKTLMLNGCELIMRAAQMADEEEYEGRGGQLQLEMEGDFGLDIRRARGRINQLLKDRLGRRAGSASMAIDAAGDNLADLLSACERVQRYVALFVDEGLAEELERGMREAVGL